MQILHAIPERTSLAYCVKYGETSQWRIVT